MDTSSPVFIYIVFLSLEYVFNTNFYRATIFIGRDHNHLQGASILFPMLATTRLASNVIAISITSLAHHHLHRRQFPKGTWDILFVHRGTIFIDI
jgi:hypothetical protein